MHKKTVSVPSASKGYCFQLGVIGLVSFGMGMVNERNGGLPQGGSGRLLWCLMPTQASPDASLLTSLYRVGQGHLRGSLTEFEVARAPTDGKHQARLRDWASESETGEGP